MINLIIWFASFFCTNPNHTATNHGDCNLIHTTTVSTNAGEPEEGDTGGETGGHPHNPPPPPPPPGN